MQSAEHTLSSRRGNAMDIAGLEIALLRASDIPARYVHGTIEVDEARFRNWAGGYEDIMAASDYAASGGIPIQAIVEAGRVARIQIEHVMEHVWVEAAVDYFPSRGAVNHSADAWIPLDPSYKQYEYLEGIDVAAVTGTDPQALAQSFLDSGACFPPH
jgi:transglutaminase-like putative cysteine protease